MKAIVLYLGRFYPVLISRIAIEHRCDDVHSPPYAAVSLEGVIDLGRVCDVTMPEELPTSQKLLPPAEKTPAALPFRPVL